MLKTGNKSCRESLQAIPQYHERDLNIAKETRKKPQGVKKYYHTANVYYSLGDVKKAIRYHERCLEIARKVGDVSSEGAAYCNLGSDYHKLGDFKKAIHYNERHLEIARKVGDISSEGTAYGNLGSDYYKLGDLKKAIDYHVRHLEIARKVGDISSEGKAYGNLGSDYYKLGDLKKAIDYHGRCLEIATKVGDISSEGQAYGNLGSDYHKLGDFKKAIDYHGRCLEIARKVGNISSEGTAYSNLGTEYLELGDLKKAIDYHGRCLEIARKVGNISSEGTAYGNLGSDYYKLGDLKKAIDYHGRCLEIATKVGDISSEGMAYSNLGTDYLELGDLKKAIDYHGRCLEIARKVGDISSEGMAYGNLGSDYYKLGDLKKAIDYHGRCLEIARKVGDISSEGMAYGNLGSDYYKLGDLKKAIDYHGRCLEIARKVGDISSEGTADGYLGTDYLNLGDLVKAKYYHERALECAQEVGNKASIAYLFCNLGNVFQSMGSSCKAVDCYRHSITTLNNVRRKLAFHDDWKVNLSHFYQLPFVNLWRLLLKQDKVMEALLSAEQGRAQALNDLMEFKYASKQFREESGTEIETTADIRSSFPSSTVFLALGDQEVDFWVLQKGKDVQLRRKQIPDGQVDADNFLDTTRKKIRGRAVVECEDRSLDTTRNGNLADESSPTNERGNRPPGRQQNSALTALYETIISPIQDLLLENEVIFVPEGPLCLAPFAAFMNLDSKYLCESFRVRVIPSLTTLKLITDCPANYHMKSGVLIVGDPWIQDVTFEGIKFPQLKFAREEALMIGRILHTAPLIGEYATKNEVLKRLSSAALVHIAAHGRMATGEIALAPNPSAGSQYPVDKDFVLTMGDVLNVQIRARLVVLSCCHSGRGDIKAEGVVGIARAFLGAGARSVLVSLWAIDDEATWEFMKRFYQQLVKGESASAALNQAMKYMRESNEFSAVDNWAPFVLIGDDVTLQLGGQE